MSNANSAGHVHLNPDLDLVLERDTPVPVSHLWKGWTDPETLMQWFCPLPYVTTACEIDLRPGGLFHTVMRSPEGEEHDNAGSFLVVEPEHRLVWTSILLADFRPNVAEAKLGSESENAPSLHFSCELTFTEIPGGSRYRAIARHGTTAACAMHAEMGFVDGWGAALDQLVALYTG